MPSACHHVTVFAGDEAASCEARVELQRFLAGKIERFAGSSGATFAVLVSTKKELESLCAEWASATGASVTVSSKAAPLADLAAEDAALAVLAEGAESGGPADPASV